MSDFVPKQLGKLRASLQSFVKELPERAAALGVPPAEEAEVLAALNAAINAIDGVEMGKRAYKSALAERDRVLPLALGLYRPTVARIKTGPNYTEADGAVLSIAPRRRRIDPDTLKPHFTITVQLKTVRLRVRRRGATMVGLRARRLGETKWNDLGQAARATVLRPIPTLPPGQAEVWEFCVVPYLGDKQVGQPSDIKTVVFGAMQVAEAAPKASR